MSSYKTLQKTGAAGAKKTMGSQNFYYPPYSCAGAKRRKCLARTRGKVVAIVPCANIIRKKGP